MKLFRFGLEILFVSSIALGACGAEVAEEEDDGLSGEETGQTSQEHKGCSAAEMKTAAAKCGSKAKVAHCHSNGPKKAPSVGCKK